MPGEEIRIKPTREGWKLLRNIMISIELLAEQLGFVINYTVERLDQQLEGTTRMSDVSDALGITVREGESMIEALTRTAKEKAATNAVTRLNQEGIDKDHALANDLEKKAKKSTKKASNSKSLIASAVGGDPNAGEPVQPEIFSAVHLYKQPGQTDGQVRYSATHEREMHGPNTLVFCHLHQFGQKCDSSCKLKILQEG